MSEQNEDKEVVEALSVLIAFAQNRTDHISNGVCPDQLVGSASRDEDCHVCKALNVIGSSALNTIRAAYDKAERSIWY